MELENVNKIGRKEDINLGWNITASVGFSSTVIGADTDRWVISSAASKFFIDSLDNLWSWDISFSSKYANNRFEDAILDTSLKYYRRYNEWNSLYLAIDATISKRLYLDKQLTIGGDSGLRGYPLKYQTGDRRFLLKIEQRYYTDWEVFQLFNVGAAVFTDIGRAWFRGEYNGAIDDGILKDVGVGLRLSSTRTGNNNIIHIDLSKPIGAKGDTSGLQWLISGKSEF